MSKFRTPFTGAVSVFVSFDQANPVSVSRTKQSFRQEADINHIISKARKTGFLIDPMTPQRKAIFGNFADMPDFLQSQERVAKARSAFDTLPAEVRAKFLNDPALLIEFVSDPQNKEQAIALGLFPKPVYTRKIVETVDADGVPSRFVASLKDGVEIDRVPVKAVAPTAPAPGAGVAGGGSGS